MTRNALLHDVDTRAELERRVRALEEGRRPLWGQMTGDQMFWHVNQGLSAALGELTVTDPRPPLPRKLLKFMVLNLPWGKNAPTTPSFRATAAYDFSAEQGRCLRLIDTFTRRPLAELASRHPAFGPMSGSDFSRLNAKHLDHHLRQFGV